MKYCTKCKEIKDTSCFSKNAQLLDGFQAFCKQCCNRYREKYKAAIPILPTNGILKCTCCRVEKPIDCFNKSVTAKTGHSTICRDCCIKFSKKRNEEYVKQHGISEYSQNRKDRVMWIRAIKANKPCADCGVVYEPKCMDYDHLRDKIKPVSRMILDNTSKEVILKEIEKCELVCLLCHNKRTYMRQKRRDKSLYTNTVNRNFEIIKEAKQTPCAYCGVQREEYNMQFDHIDSKTKFKDICQLKNYKTEILLKELEKCQVICAMCHRKKSLLQQKMGQYPVKRSKPKKPYVGDTDQECVRCHDIKSYDQFIKHAKTRSGYNSWCKPCMNEYRRERRAAKRR